MVLWEVPNAEQVLETALRNNLALFRPIAWRKPQGQAQLIPKGLRERPFGGGSTQLPAMAARAR